MERNSHNRAVIVAGSGRCGSSLVTDLLRGVGFSLGPPGMYDTLTGPNAQRLGRDGGYIMNPRGYWELPATLRLNEELIAQALQLPERDAWMNSLPTHEQLRNLWRQPLVRSLQEKVSAHVKSLRSDQATWIAKDPRFCYTLPFWLPAVPESVTVVHSVRHPLSVARSFTRITGFRGDRMTTDDVVQHWLTKNEALIYVCEHWKLRTIVVAYEDLIRVGWPAISRLLEFVGVSDTDLEDRCMALQECVDPSLNRNDVALESAMAEDWHTRYPEAAALYASLLTRAGA